MPDYKRKRRSRFSSAPKINQKRINKESRFEDIKMTPQNSEIKGPNSSMRVVKGKKLEQKRRFKLFSKVLAVLVLVLLFCQIITPAGVFETVSNSLSLLGSGTYPAELESGNTVNVVSKGSYYYLLTDTEINAFSNSGKLVFSYAHGFENPVLKTSKTRALVFNQGGKQVLIFTLNGLQTNLTIDDEITNAAIGDNGTYALVTTSGNYAAAVSVYKKDNKMVYQWFSSQDLVNNVAVSPNGKKIAVATLSSKVGQYNSTISVLNFKSATPENQKEFANTVIYSLDTTSTKGFSLITSNGYNFISWNRFKVLEYKNEYNTVMFRTSNNGVLAVYNRESDKTDNRIAVFAKNGKLKKVLEFKGIITDIALLNGHIYCITDTKAYILDDDGSVLRSGECGFGVVRMAIIGQNAIAAITDNEINKIKLEQE